MNPTKYITFLVLFIAFSLKASADSRLDEIVVTAQKKAEGLAEVPISIQVLTGDRISDLGITSVESLANHVPGLHVTKGAGEWNIYMRGVGYGANKGFSQ